MYYEVEWLYSEGDTVEYRGSFGRGATEIVVIVRGDEKNDQPVYGLSNGHWCYEYQIVRKISKPVIEGVK